MGCESGCGSRSLFHADTATYVVRDVLHPSTRVRCARVGGASHRRPQGEKTRRDIVGCFFRYEERRARSRIRSSGPSDTVPKLQVLLDETQRLWIALDGFCFRSTVGPKHFEHDSRERLQEP